MSSQTAVRPVPVRIVFHAWSLRSFRAQVALGFGGLVIGVAVALSLALAWMFSEQSRRDEVVDLHSVARNAAKMLGDGLAFRSRELETLANSTTLWSDGLNSDRVAQMLERVRTVTPHSAWIGVTSPDGVVQSAIDGLLVGKSVAERPWFQEAHRGSHVGDVHAGKLLASLLPADLDGAPQRFVDFASPIRRNGQLVGVIGMHGSWAWTRSVVESLLPDDAAARRLEVFVLDRNGRPIYASAGGDLARWRDGVLNRDATTGAEYLLVTVKVPDEGLPQNLGWSVVAREPTAIAFAVARRGVLRSLAFAALASVIACGVGAWLATRMTRPLYRIADAARLVEEGAQGASIPLLTNNPEVTQLSAALAGMTRKLQGANEALEARVRERTAELERVNVELDRQNRTDPLTGLLNRRGLEDQFTRAMAAARRRRAPLSVLMIDIDHFKRVNDTFGHEAGDHALQALATVLVRRLRETDAIARFGGEEFAVLLPDTDATQARLVAEQVVDLVAGQPMPQVGRITISCGVAPVSLAQDSAQAALARADKALYRAKEAGRNRACAEEALEV